MKRRWRIPIWLLLLPTSLCLADVGLALRGQPHTYWQASYSNVNEGNPIARCNHAVGAAAWLFFSGRYGLWLSLTFLAMVAILAMPLWKMRHRG